MKWIAPFAVIILLSCRDSGLSEEEKSHIQTLIQSKNATVYLKFVKDSLAEDLRTRRKFELLPVDSIRDYLKSHGQVYANEWNQPYDINKDYKLTVQKYLDYCEANGKDPKSFYKILLY